MLKNLLFLLVTAGSLLAVDYTIFEESSNPDICNTILNGLEDFNIHFFRQKDPSSAINPFVIYARDESSKIIGGLCGYVFENNFRSWVHVDYAWVDKSRRLQGLGTQLFERAETLAKTKNCKAIQLFTWAYQAVGFYEKLGFKCVGIVPKWIDDYDAVFFRKELCN